MWIERRTEKGRRLAGEILEFLAISLLISVFVFCFLYFTASSIADTYLMGRGIALNEEQSAVFDVWLGSICLIAVSLIFICLFLFLLGQRLAYLKTIIQGIKDLEANEMNCRIPLEGEDELTRLAESIHYLAASQREVARKERELQEEREAWIRSLSHDIRTPLTSMLSYAEFLRGKEMTAQEMEAFLDLVEGKAGQIRELTKQLVEWEGGIREEVEDIRILAEQLVVEWEEILEERFLLRIDLNGCGHLGGKLDIYGLRRVLDNLASNVEKYADPEKEVELTIWTEGKSLCLLQRNGIAQRQTFVGDSHRLGLENMRRVAGEGGVQVRRAEGQFEIQVELRIE